MFAGSKMDLLLTSAVGAFFGTLAVVDPEHRFVSVFFLLILVSSLLKRRRGRALDARAGVRDTFSGG